MTVELGPGADDVETVLDVQVDDLCDAVDARGAVPVQWTWQVDGAVVTLTARRDDTQARHLTASPPIP